MKRVTDLISFPCSYSLKVIGRNNNEFHAVVRAILERHIGEIDRITFSSKNSSGNKYSSITATFPAQSREQLTDIYLDLEKRDLVMITL